MSKKEQKPSTTVKYAEKPKPNECKLKKKHKTLLACLYKGKMPKFVKLTFGASHLTEKSAMTHEVKRPNGYNGI